MADLKSVVDKAAAVAAAQIKSDVLDLLKKVPKDVKLEKSDIEALVSIAEEELEAELKRQVK